MSSAEVIQFAGPRPNATHGILETHVADLNERLARVAREQAPVENALADAVDTIDDGFALWDAWDRLILCNRQYRRVYPLGQDLFVRGAHFRDIVAECARRGQYASIAPNLDAWVENQVRQHQETNGPHTEALAGERWLVVHERRLADGGIIGVCVDVTKMQGR